MLRVGLTGGIGSGKSTVARRLAQLGAVLVDSDVLARDVVAAGTEGHAAILATFGDTMLGPDGELDRARLAGLVFGDPIARERLNAIVHPRVRARSAELIAAAPADVIVVQDVPLLVENGMAPAFPLVVVVHADPEERVRRLVHIRGIPEDDARSRIAAQVGDDARRAAADVWLDNSGSPDRIVRELDALWRDRLVPFKDNLRRRRPVGGGAPRLVAPHPEWPAQATRLAARVAAAAGERGRGVAHIGSTAVPGLPAQDVIDLQLGVDSMAEADALRDALAGAGFPVRPGITSDNPKPPGSATWPQRLHGSADPGRIVHLHVRAVGSPGWRYALLLRDWLRTHVAAREEYLSIKRAAEARYGGDRDAARYVEAKEPWFDMVFPRVERWAATSGWCASLS